MQRGRDVHAATDFESSEVQVECPARARCRFPAANKSPSETSRRTLRERRLSGERYCKYIATNEIAPNEIDEHI